ncbi:amidase [Paraburkholderia ferrariae]|uniref:amidase n=1 Tax=Paraburkholderia ferrariae TaxID=386056 RepID=UPI0005A73ED2|nr:amidase [Paraburkholderia ferrariae]
MLKGDLWQWDAQATATAIRAGKISCREAVEAALNRLHQVNPAINAVVDVMEADALAAADRADAQLAAGDAVGPLHGVPVTCKINVDVAGRAPTNGLVAMKDARAVADSAPAANLRRAGAIVIGLTNVPAFCYRWFTDNDLHGLTRNPWNRTLSPGGSSGGAAAALAAGIGALAHGNDVAGSIRLPASACGVYGLKPTVGRVPTHNPSAPGERPLCIQIGATEGVLARSVRDLRLGLSALEYPDPRDPCQVPAPAHDASQSRPCRVALFTGETEGWTHPEVAATASRAAAWLADAGYVVEELAPPRFAEMADLWMTMLYAESSGPVREFLLSLGGQDYGRATLNTAASLPAMSHAELHQAWEKRLGILREWAMFLERYPLVMIPTTFQPAFPLNHDLIGPDVTKEIMQAYRPLTSVAGLALPGLSVPAGFAAGAPAGVQLIAGRFQEERCLSAAAIMEQRIGPTLPVDPFEDEA